MKIAYKEDEYEIPMIFPLTGGFKRVAGKYKK
jgi:hypothetical protein